jgi:hypothetical protein
LPDEHYDFIQWEWNDEPVAIEEIIVRADMLLVAVFAPRTYAVTVTVNDETRGTAVRGGGTAYGEEATVTAAPWLGYVAQFYLNGKPTEPAAENELSFTVGGDTVVYVEFVIKTYNVLIVVNDGPNPTVTEVLYPEGAPLAVDYLPPAGWVIAYISVETETDEPIAFGSLAEVRESYTVLSDLTLTIILVSV